VSRNGRESEAAVVAVAGGVPVSAFAGEAVSPSDVPWVLFVAVFVDCVDDVSAEDGEPFEDASEVEALAFSDRVGVGTVNVSG